MGDTLRASSQFARRYCANLGRKVSTGQYPLANLFVFVTMRCNAKCDHCFCWADLNVGIPEMSLEQLSRLAQSCPPYDTVIFTGGEPTLRRDLGAICDLFASSHGPRKIKINTNGFATSKILELAETFAPKYPDKGLIFQVSIDGPDTIHDRIRGVPGSFEKAVQSLRGLRDAQQRLPNVAIEVLTVVNAVNYKSLIELNDTLCERVAPGIPHGFEMVRDVNTTAWNILESIKEQGVGPKQMDPPPVESFPEIAAAYRFLLRRSQSKFNPYHVHNLAQLEMLASGKPAFPCRVAGEAVGVVYSNGDVTACEFTKPFSNLADYDWDFSKCWNGKEADARRSQIKACHCIHGSFHGKAVEYSISGLLRSGFEAVTASLSKS
jgi:MoaA/NifB/PqqE/SkfB family radical SAM enzyme